MRLRESDRPVASNMRLLSYSYEMQGLTEEWVSRCDSTKPFDELNGFPPGIKGNIAILHDNETPQMIGLASLWETEREFFHYNPNLCKANCTNCTNEIGSSAYTAFGGNVKWQNSDTPIKQFVSQLRVHVHSLPDDTLRQIVHVLPNGAYSVVVSDKSRYKIRLSAPQGWSFLPNDGYTIDLSKNDQKNHMDYGFDLTGFDVSGQVVTMGMKTGPPDLIVTALSSDNTVVSHTKTKADGSFILVSIPPGQYFITVGDSVYKDKSDARVSTRVTVSTNSLELAEPLVLEGHSLSSRVTFNGHGFANIPVVLFSSKSGELNAGDFKKLGCLKPTVPLGNLISADLKELINPEPACQVISDNDGSFTFSRLAGGEYFLVAIYDPALMKSSEIKSYHLELHPPFLRVTMEHTDQQIEPGFQVTSYRLSGGKVKQASGKPIADADIIVNGVPVTKTDVNGTYELDLSSSAEYEIQVRAPRLKFEKVSVNLTPSTASLPSFTPREVEICGKFVVSSSLNSVARFPNVEVANAPTIQPSVSNDSTSARFCAYLSPDKHTLRLAKASKFIPFAPSSVNIDLASGPVSDLVFTQFQAVLKGEIVCIDKCPILKLAVRLSSEDRSDSNSVISHLEADKDDEKRAIFSFNNVAPGTYDLELVTEDSNLVASGWCWSSPGLLRHITVVDQDLHGIPELIFRQTGYRLHIDVPLLDFGFKIPVDFKVTPLVTINGSSTFGKPFFYRLTKSLNNICLPAGSFSFEATTSCLKLEHPSPSTIKSAHIPVSLPSKTILVSVHEIPISAAIIAQPFEGFTNESSLPEVIIQAQVNGSVKKSSAKWKKEGSMFVSRMSLWASPDSEVVFSVSPAKPPSDMDTVRPLIHPKSQTLRVPSITYLSTHSTYDGNELEFSATALPKIDELNCKGVLETAFGELSSTFSMKSGLFFTGTVQPAVPNALVTVHADPSIVISSPPEVTSNMAGLFSEQELNRPPFRPDFTLAARALTDARGAFRIGPFYFEKQTASSTRSPNSLLVVSIHKPGFEFIQNSATDWLTFKARKLALVEIRVVSDEVQKPLPGTLISIIGSVYRDSRTTDSLGLVRYVGLPPGKCY
ncbi:hypothetical protein Aperf_G00000000607 [Anoplocephala perfoliata]